MFTVSQCRMLHYFIMHAGIGHDRDPLQNAPDTKDLMNKVAVKALDVWDKVALELDIDKGQIKSIKRAKMDEALDCYMEVFDIWERRTIPPYTWATIIQVLRKPTVNKTDLAKQLEEDLCSN